ncbi:MAG: HlyD family efflux transporter periplasmic adaptor subunit [Luteitalea sp.]|nr:HlyD family efflux transporter periplasmic adaptor subunit [Luteitalea sp.]
MNYQELRPVRFVKRRRKLSIAVGISLLLVALVVANLAFRREAGKPVTVEAVQRRDLESVVTASGTIQARRTVEISADVAGRITKLAVDEGQRVKAGQFLMEIDPRMFRSQYQQNQAGLAAAQSQLTEQDSTIEAGRQNVELARENLRRQQELWAQELTTREALDQAQNDLKVNEADLRARVQALKTLEARVREQQAAVANAGYQLSKVRIESPIEGLVVRRAVEEGETAVVGTMNNPGTVLLTIADMSVIEAELEIDETDMPTVDRGQSASVSIDALTGRTFNGQVTEVGNSPIQATTGVTGTTGQQATTFKVVVTVNGEIPQVRPGFTCTTEIITATRKNAMTVPIQALAVRDVVYDRAGNIVRQESDSQEQGGSGFATASAQELPAGQTRKEEEGVFVLRNDQAIFMPVRTGIAGDRHFELLSGLRGGDQVITGPFSSVRELQDGDQVKLQAPQSTRR